ncbi:Fic family protein [Legionella brunensis]|uniref:Fic/DOC family protein n=1 Tax=Legionella brunensis TaxID=29422 RepID=A0A0W0SNJ1_9GAMM|nr:Fic family protein [Legionella brunensis]KTC84928.1 Fic/DOC family protein [Legionella brunensis]
MYNLEDLTEFNPALIYAFEPESSPLRLAGSETFQDALFPEAGQHEDMLNAYLYAQKTILPYIREKGLDKVDEKLLLEWINKLHGFIGNTLLATHGHQAGVYTQQMVMRWHQGAQLSTDFILYFSNLHKAKSKTTFAKALEMQGVAEEDALPFINLLEKIKNNKSIKPHPSQTPFIDPKNPTSPGAIVLHKLATAYHEGKLTTQEKKLVDRIVKVCRYPHELPQAMEKFATESLQQLRKLDPNNLPDIANCLGKIFYEFTDIHPYGNANGRTGTCLINIFLRALGQPSILLRHPGEKENESSDYSQAIKLIDSTIEPLQKLILKRIVDAKETIFADEKLKQVIALRVAASTLLKRIQQKHPLFDLETLRDKLVLQSLLLTQVEDINVSSIILLTALIDIAAKEEKRLDDVKLKPLLPAPISMEQRQAVIAALEKLTGKTGWKTANKDGLMAWLEVPSLEDQQETVSTLDKIKVATSVLPMLRQDNGVRVVQCKNINIEKIISLANQTLTKPMLLDNFA